MNFLSEANVALHKEYLRTLKLKRVIFEKSYSGISDVGFKREYELNIPRSEKDELFELNRKIISHELFFSSFGASGRRCEAVKNAYGSEAKFLYVLLCGCLESRGEFMYIFLDKNGEIRFTDDYRKLKVIPKIAVDLCEHAYFYDFGFDRHEYLRKALSRLDLLKIANKVEKN